MLSTTALLGLIPGVAYAQFQDPGLPKLPEQFEAVIEANNVNENYTVHMHEWHDPKNDRARTDWYSNRAHASSTSIYDFKKNRYFQVSARGCQWGDVNHIRGRTSGLTVDASDGTPHVTSSEQYFRFGAQYKEVYQGRKKVRGIDADHWIADMGRNRTETNETKDKWTWHNMSGATLDYYFSVPGWKIPETDSTRVPLRLVLEGWRTTTSSRNNTCIGIVRKDPKHTRADYRKCMIPLPPNKWTNHTYLHVYDYTAFHVGPHDNSVFAKPCGHVCHSSNKTWNPLSLPALGCPGKCDAKLSSPPRGGGRRGGRSAGDRARGKAPPPPPPPPPPGTWPTLPKDFEATVELNIVKDVPGNTWTGGSGSTEHWREWASHTKQKIRLEHYHSGTGVTSHIVMDLAKNLYHEENGTECKWGDMSHRSKMGNAIGHWVLQEGSSKPGLKSTASLMGFSKKITVWCGGDCSKEVTVEQKYKGTASIRGITCDQWTTSYTSRDDDTTKQTVTADYYFAIPAWEIPEAHGHQVPIRRHMKGTYFNKTKCNELSRNTNCDDRKYGALSDFEFVMDYTSFHVGDPETSVFDLPCGATCASVNQTWSKDAKKGSTCASKCPPPPAPVCNQRSVCTSSGVQPCGALAPAPLPACNVPTNSSSAEVTLSGDIASIASGTIARALFENNFQKDTAKLLEDGPVCADALTGLSAGDNAEKVCTNAAACTFTNVTYGNATNATLSCSATAFEASRVKVLSVTAGSLKVKFAVKPDSNGESIDTSKITNAFKATGVSIAGQKTTTKIDSNSIKTMIDCVGSWSKWTVCDKIVKKKSDGKKNDHFATQDRVYTIATTMANEGKACEAPHGKKENQKCKIDCEGEYAGSWGKCSLACYDDRDKKIGKQKKQFFISIDATNGGKPCTQKAQEQECNKKGCKDEYQDSKDADIDTPPAGSSGVRAAAGMVVAALAAMLMVVS